MTSPAQIPELTLETPIEVVRGLLAAPESVAAMSESQLFMASEIAHLAQDRATAIAAMTAVVAIAPREAVHYFRLGFFERYGGDVADAERHFRKALSLDPAFEPSYAELRGLLAAQGDTDGALAVLARQEEVFGASHALLLTRINLLRQGNRMLDALALLRPLLAQDPGEDVVRAAAEIAHEAGRNEDAVVYARRLCREYPATASHRVLLARLLCAGRRFEEAVPLLEGLTRDAPDDVDMLRLLSVALTETGRYRQALEAALRTTELQPGASEFWYHASALANILGHTEEAIDWLGRALDLDPSNATLLVSRAHLLAGLGRMSEAVAALDEARRLYPDDANIQDLRLMLLTRLSEEFVAPEHASDLVKPLPMAQRSTPRPRPTDGSDGLRQLWESARIQYRVIAALVTREMAHRTAHSKFGLMSAVVEPLLQIMMLGIVLRIFNNGRPPLGNDLFFFYSTGVLPFYLVLHIIDHTLNIYVENASILQVPRIRRIDLVIAAAFAELLIGGMTTALVFTFFFAFGYGEGLDNIAQAVFAYFAVWLFAFGVGLIGAVVNNLTKLWERAWITVARFLYFLSGIFFIPQMMPNWARDILVWNPLLVGIEWFRSGFFIGYSPPWIDKPYMISVSLACIVIGLVLERALRRRLRTTL